MWTTIITEPLYNSLIVLIKTMPFYDVGLAVIMLTIIVKLILLPLSIKAAKFQIEMKKNEGDLKSIQDKYKNNKEEQSKKVIEFYKEKNINPFAGFFVIIIQFPIVIGLYRIFLKSGLPTINTSLLYSFISPNILPNMMFLGFINMAGKSIILALIAGITSYFQVYLATKTQGNTGSGMQGDIAKAMNVQMKYFFPVLMVFIAYSISNAVALYLITNNIFAIVQEIYIKKKYHQSVSVM